MIAMISLLALAAFSVASITGYGYQTWGRVHTFSGGYFFKTDMALSALILLCLALVGLRSKALSLAAVSMAGYLTLLTNTRIAIPLILAIPLLTG
ncbi:hypothetical protein C0099_12695 [Pseudazoarcus pumilus]|uniref:Uncharacterized protein n=1 Tax=Pseudazoarcus pumilus TaxID=2067960 RepID=A0A2I6S8X5_9RHOO|nr:hypothetical protein C0099_12695 [Pseudazoarcus pumilus]